MFLCGGKTMYPNNNFGLNLDKLKLTHRQSPSQHTIVQVGDITFGGSDIAIIAGPCSVESKEQIHNIAEETKRLGAHILRGGAYKPRTSPYEFQGLRETGLQLLAQAREKTGMSVVTEVLSPELVDVVSEYADMLQIGARNMQNYELLKAVGRTNKPVLLKRGMSATIEEFLLAAEYILVSGNENVILCERGIRTFETATRNTLDLSAVALLKQVTHLPVIVDPSHASGRNKLVLPLAKAAIAVGADGIMVEVHHQPENALSDGDQSLDLEMFADMMAELYKLASVLDRSIPTQSIEQLKPSVSY